jgi:WD40 repeat protein
MMFKRPRLIAALMLGVLWHWIPLIAQTVNSDQPAVKAPTLVVQSGHNFAIQCIVFSHNGHWLATAGWDGNVKVWDAAAGLEVATLSRHSGALSTVAFSSNDRLLASAGADHTITLWDFNTGQQKLKMEGHRDVVDSFSFSADG